MKMIQKEPWIIEAEQDAKLLAETLYEQIADKADDLSVERIWFFEKVVYYMRGGNNEN